MHITLYLDKPERATTSVLLNIALSGKRIRFGTGVTIAPEHWNKAKQKVRSTDPLQNAHQKKLDALTTFIKSAYNELNPVGTTKALSNEDIGAFKARVREYLAPHKHEPNIAPTPFQGMFELFMQTYTIQTRSGMITNQRPGERMMSLYQLVLNDLTTWSEKYRYELSFDTINDEFFKRYTTWLSSERGLLDSTISNHTKVIKTFMKWAKYKGYHANSAYERFWRDKRTGTTIALTVEEVRKLRDLDLSDAPRLARVRDLFLLQTFTGLRYGDLTRLEPRHFVETDSCGGRGVIRFTTSKTDTPCIIPITQPLAVLLERYPSRLFEFPSNVKMNVYLKELGERAGLNQEVSTSHYKAGKRVEEQAPRSALLTTHVARRTFVTTSTRFGVPESIISAVTGHSTKGMLQDHYIKLDEEAVCESICAAWERL